ncbi:MAG: carboxypeptidase regulatory-like domain-containing protein, partial [Candidatus Hydrogenedentes bacterium]|nr:carboxypeptidase regulatory-like domain-containing protein [Candidatus Hydrogenedentota bacterium]
MQSNIRFYVLVAIVLVALGGFWFMIRGGKSTPETAPPAKQMAKATEDKPEPKAETEHIENTKPVPESAAPTGNYQSVSNGARSGDGVVTGTAKDDSGDPVAGATVRLLPITWKNYEPRPTDTDTLETQTDNDGKFSFSGVPIKMSIGIEAELGTLYALDGIYIGE